MVEKVADPRKVKKTDVEPDVSKIQHGQDAYTTMLMRALSWYHAESDRKTAAKWLRAWMKIHRPADLKAFDTVKGEPHPTYGYLARLILRGAKISDLHTENINLHLNEFLERAEAPKPQVQKTVNRPSIQDAMDAKIREYLGSLEGAFDDYITAGTEFSLESDLRSKEIPQAYVQRIQDWAKAKLREWIEILESKDPDIQEGYAHYNKTAKKNVAKFFATMVEDCTKYGAFKKANRAPRPKKVKPATVQVAKLQFMKDFPELSLSSVSPVEIIGASQVWIYNTKSKRVCVYRTDSGQGIQCKGTRLQNYDPDMSEQRTLRKPGPMTQEILQAGKVQLRKFMESLTTKPSTPNGIVNSECIILRVVK